MNCMKIQKGQGEGGELGSDILGMKSETRLKGHQ